MIPTLLTVCCKRLGRLCFFPKAFAGFKFSKTLRNCTCIAQRSFPRKEVSVPINSRGAPLTAAGVACTPCSFSDSAGPPELCVLYFLSQNKDSGCCVCSYSAGTEMIRPSLSRELPRLLEACDHSEPCHCHCSSAAASPMLVVLPPLRFRMSQKASTLLKCNVAPWVERSDH